MSYILDALRRADAERERGAVPSLQSQQHTIIEDDAAPARPRSLVWAVIALAVACSRCSPGIFLGGTAPPARTPVEGSITPPVPAPLPALQPCPRLARTGTEPAMPTASAAVGTAPATTAMPAPVLQATPAPPPVAMAPPPARATADARRAPAPPPAKRVGAATTAAPAAAEPRVHSQAELPEDIRRDLPKLVIGGSSYSGDAASRMVMINGQVFP